MRRLCLPCRGWKTLLFTVFCVAALHLTSTSSEKYRQNTCFENVETHSLNTDTDVSDEYAEKAFVASVLSAPCAALGMASFPKMLWQAIDGNTFSARVLLTPMAYADSLRTYNKRMPTPMTSLAFLLRRGFPG